MILPRRTGKGGLLVVTHTAHSGGVLNRNENGLGTGTRRRTKESVTRGCPSSSKRARTVQKYLVEGCTASSSV